MENYKLFDCLEIDLQNDLNIFDGPNGYGKTSIFDAIEFIITGDISRLTTCSVLDGKVAYEGVALAKDSNKDVIIKAEILTEEESCTIIKKIKARVSNNNPKKLTEVTETYLVADFDTIEFKADNLIEGDRQKGMQEKYFGKHSQSLYNLLYYVQQEDRLQYLKKSERNRVEAINSLFQTGEIEELQTKISTSKSTLRDLIKRLEEKIAANKQQINEKMENTPGNDAVYKKIFAKPLKWDEENPELNTKEALVDALNTLKRTKEFINQKGEYIKDQQNKRIKRFLDTTGADVYEAFILYKKMGESYETYVKNRRALQFITQVLKQVESLEYEKIDLTELEKLIKKQEAVNQIKNYLLEYQQTTRTGKRVESAVKGLFELREKFIIHDKKGLIDEAKCAYCGCDWGEKTILDTQIKKTTEELKILMGEAEKNLTIIRDNIKKLFETELIDPLETLKKSLESDTLLIAFVASDESSFESRYQYVQSFLDKLQITVPKNLKFDEMAESIILLKNQVKENLSVVEEAYRISDTEHDFQDLLGKYFNTIDDLKDLNEVDITQKEEYLRFKYEISQIEKQKEIQILESAKDVLEKQVSKAVAQYEKDVKNAKAQFIGNIVAKIEIPFYLYSARLLQSYQAGQGIIIKENSAGKFTNIRFTIPGGEHDVLYTMSSGQLSGILLSYFLVLNKTFAKEGLSTLLIDDPVQCMDDINIISFVELIKTEFTESQIMISTHENSFANYISYKYKKHSRSSKRHNLKEITNINL